MGKIKNVFIAIAALLAVYLLSGALGCEPTHIVMDVLFIDYFATKFTKKEEE